MSPQDVFEETCREGSGVLEGFRIIPGRYLQLCRERKPVEESNFLVAEKLLAEVDPDGLYHKVFSEANPFTGRADLFAIRVNAPPEVVQIVADIICALDDYPILDEHDHSMRELESAEHSYDPEALRNELISLLPVGLDRLESLIEDSYLDPREVTSIEWEYEYEGDHPYFKFRPTRQNAREFALEVFRQRRNP